jgi:hypothetical protein
LPQRLLQESFLRGGGVPDWLSDPSQLNGATLDRAMANFARDADIEYISLVGLLCKQALCTTTVPRGEERSFIERDYSHLTTDGANRIVNRRVAPVVIKELTTQP